MSPNQCQHSKTFSFADRKLTSSHPRVLWVAPHSCWTKQVKVYDVTSFELPTANRDHYDYKLLQKQVEKQLGAADGGNTISPLWTFEKQGLFKNLLAFEGDPPAEDEPASKRQGKSVMKWDQAKWEYGKTCFIFSNIPGITDTIPASSCDSISGIPRDIRHTYPTHNITMERNKSNPFDRTESFVADSVRYEWRFDTIWTPRHLSLFRYGAGGQIKVVARYEGHIPLYQAMGVLWVDDEDLNEGMFFLVVSTCVAILRKDLKRQN
jgi:hypothetical protein